MSDYIVLVKQVPDISQITENVFNPETGTLIRNRLTNVINELDGQALALAGFMKHISGCRSSRIIAITMGPPWAAEVLRYCLARCADTAILLSDKKLSGADTWATANSLAFAIRKVVREILGGSSDYFIIGGMQSVDGDTAQVPSQIAAELDIPCLPYITDVSYSSNEFVFTAITSGGSLVARPKTKPAVLTVAKYQYPLFAGFAAARAAAGASIINWTADDIETKDVGVAGSKTQVIHIFPPGKTTRKCRQITDVKEFTAILSEHAKCDSQDDFSGDQGCKYALPCDRANPFERNFEITDKENEHYAVLKDTLIKMGIADVSSLDKVRIDSVCSRLSHTYHETTVRDMIAGLKAATPYYDGDVWVIAERQGNNIHIATFELIGKARQLADGLNKKVGVVVAGKEARHFCRELIFAGADVVYIAEHPLLEQPDPKCHKKAISEIAAKYKPQIVLYAATPWARALAPMTAYSLNCGLTADCTSLDIRDISRKNEIAILMQTRPALGGNIMASIYTKNSSCQMVTVRPGVMKRLPKDTARRGEIIICEPQISDSDLSLEIISIEKTSGAANLGSEIVVCGGKGLQSRDNYEQLLSHLTAALSARLGTSAAKGATRAAVEHGFTERSHQIGQTGTTICPKVYLGLGVSGAIQHTIGIANAGAIFAVNNDPEAPIFKQCDYYIVGSVENIVPEIIANLEAKP